MGGPPAKKAKTSIRRCVCGCTRKHAPDIVFERSHFFEIPPKRQKDPEKTDYALLDCVLTQLVGSEWETQLPKPAMRNICALRDEPDGAGNCVYLLKAHVKEAYTKPRANGSFLLYDKFKQQCLYGEQNTTPVFEPMEDVISGLQLAQRNASRPPTPQLPPAEAPFTMQRKIARLRKELDTMKEKYEAKISRLEAMPPMHLGRLNDENVHAWTGFKTVECFDAFYDLLNADGYWSSILWDPHRLKTAGGGPEQGAGSGGGDGT